MVYKIDIPCPDCHKSIDKCECLSDPNPYGYIKPLYKDTHFWTAIVLILLAFGLIASFFLYLAGVFF